MWNFRVATAVGTVALLGASLADAAVAVGDRLDVQYDYPSLGVAEQDSGPFTYTGPGQTIATQFGFTIVILDGGAIDFADAGLSGDTETSAQWNGPVVTDLSNSTAFDGWKVQADNVGVSSYVLGGDTAGVNWQGAAVGLGPDDVVVGAPEPSAWALMLIGLGGLGASLRRRRAAEPVARDQSGLTASGPGPMPSPRRPAA